MATLSERMGKVEESLATIAQAVAAQAGSGPAKGKSKISQGDVRLESQRGPNRVLRWSTVEYQGEERISARVFQTDRDGVEHATKSGLTITYDEFAAAAEEFLGE